MFAITVSLSFKGYRPKDDLEYILCPDIFEE